MIARLLCLPALLIALPAPAQDMRLAWSDEFDQPAIDPAKWSFDVDCWGGGNDERQCYTDSQQNARIVDGRLVITALRQRATGPALPSTHPEKAADPDAKATRSFTSARLTTRGKAAWRYGRIEVRVRLPQGQGTWPAIWMLPEGNTYGGWAASGEIDILEAVNLGVPCAICPGGKENTILGTLHFGGVWPKNAHKGDETPAPEALEGFHTYSIDWEPDRMVWRIDGRTFAERTVGDWWSAGSASPGAPFDQPFHLIVNLAIGGKLAETRGIGGVSARDFPKRLEIDWVRVWQKVDDPARPKHGTVNQGSK